MHNPHPTGWRGGCTGWRETVVWEFGVKFDLEACFGWLKRRYSANGSEPFRIRSRNSITKPMSSCSAHGELNDTSPWERLLRLWRTSFSRNKSHSQFAMRARPPYMTCGRCSYKSLVPISRMAWKTPCCFAFHECIQSPHHIRYDKSSRIHNPGGVLSSSLQQTVAVSANSAPSSQPPAWTYSKIGFHMVSENIHFHVVLFAKAAFAYMIFEISDRPRTAHVPAVKFLPADGTVNA